MRRTVRAILWLFLLLLYGCSATHDVVGHGPFQKRKYRPGWHVDIGRGVPAPAVRTAVQRGTVHRMVATPVPPIDRITPPEPLTASVLVKEQTDRNPPARWTLPGPDTGLRTSAPLVKKILKPSDEQITDEPRRWNRMALVSGVFLLIAILIAVTGGGGIIGYILTFSVLTGIIGLLLAIKHNERGKGIAIAAIAVPLALLALVIAALNSTW